jgi:hypothetical protein
MSGETRMHNLHNRTSFIRMSTVVAIIKNLSPGIQSVIVESRQHDLYQVALTGSFLLQFVNLFSHLLGIKLSTEVRLC